MKKIKQQEVGLRKFLKDAWELTIERSRTHKALRLLNKQSWSVEFLTAMLYRAAKAYGTELEMTIMSKDGVSLMIRTTDNKPVDRLKDDDIFNNLDNDVKINQFISQIQKGSK